jgi:hypothetical protein
MKTLYMVIREKVADDPAIVGDGLIMGITERLQQHGVYASYSTIIHVLRSLNIPVRTVSKPRPAGRKPDSPRRKMRTWG